MCTADSAHEFLWWALKPCSSALFCCVEELLSFCFLTEYDLHMMLDTRVKADNYENPKMAACLRASTPVGPRDCTALAAKGQHPHGSKGLHCPVKGQHPCGSKGLHCLGSQGTAPLWVARDCTALAVERPVPPCGFLKWQHWQSRASTPASPRHCTALAVEGPVPLCGFP